MQYKFTVDLSQLVQECKSQTLYYTCSRSLYQIWIISCTYMHAHVSSDCSTYNLYTCIQNSTKCLSPEKIAVVSLKFVIEIFSRVILVLLKAIHMHTSVAMQRNRSVYVLVHVQLTEREREGKREQVSDKSCISLSI